MKPCDHDSRSRYEQLIGPLRAKARELGYALAVHGSLKRDIDLIACPWTEDAADAKTLAELLRSTVAEHNGGIAALAWAPGKGPEFTLDGCPGNKPHGRLCWTFVLGDGPYIDLSVMPRSARTDG